MSSRSSGLSSLRNDDNQSRRPDPGQPAKQGIVQTMSFRLPPINIWHPIESLKQRRLVKQHQTDLLMELLDKDREAYADRVEQDEDGDRHAYRLDKLRERFANQDDVAEALIEGQSKMTAFAQHFQRLVAINADNDIAFADDHIRHEELREKFKSHSLRQAAHTFIEVEALAMNNDVNPGNYGVVG